jgi:hypothetical protein
MTAISDTVEAPEREITRWAGHALRHVVEERRNVGRDAQLGIGRLDLVHLLDTRLLGDTQALALRFAQQR